MRAKSSRNSHRVLTRPLGQLVFCAATRRARGTLVNKESPKFHLTSRGGGDVRQWVFPVLTSSSQGSSAHQHSPEKLVLTGRGQVTGRVPTLRPFHTQVSLVPFPELGSSSLAPFCQVVLTTWAFSQSCLLGSWGWPLSFNKLKVTMENATIDSWRSVRRAQSPGVASPALYRGRKDSTTSKTVGKMALVPSRPQVPTVPRVSGTAGRPARHSGQSCEFQSPIPNDATV